MLGQIYFPKDSIVFWLCICIYSKLMNKIDNNILFTNVVVVIFLLQ